MSSGVQDDLHEVVSRNHHVRSGVQVGAGMPGGDVGGVVASQVGVYSQMGDGGTQVGAGMTGGDVVGVVARQVGVYRQAGDGGT